MLRINVLFDGLDSRLGLAHERHLNGPYETVLLLEILGVQDAGDVGHMNKLTDLLVNVDVLLLYLDELACLRNQIGVFK